MDKEQISNIATAITVLTLVGSMCAIFVAFVIRFIGWIL